MIQEGLRGKTVTDELVVMPQMHSSQSRVLLIWFVWWLLKVLLSLLS